MTDPNPNALATSGKSEVQGRDKAEIKFIPYGSQDEIKLSVSIIQNLVAVPTKSGKTCSTRDAMKFLMLCQAKRLNPFEGDCFLIGYDSKDGVATFSLITAHQAYLKRAELHPEFDGMKSGLIIERNEKIEDIEGDFHLPDDVILGGWATVFFKTRKVPMHRRLRLARFRKPFGVWNDDPAGMICKCAEADALRTSFPTMLGGLFMREEIDLPLGQAGRSDFSEVPMAPQVSALGEIQQQAARPIELQPQPPQEAKEAPANRSLAIFVKGEGFTFEQFHKWATAEGQFGDTDPENIQSFDDVPDALAKRLLRAKVGLKAGLQQLREREAK